MDLRKLVQNFLPARGDAQTDAATVGRIGRALQQTFDFAAVHQFHHSIVLQAQPVRGVGDGNGNIRFCGSHGQQQLMLLRMESGLVRCLLTGLEKSAKLVSKFRQSLMQRLVSIPIFAAGIHASQLYRITT